MDISIFQRFYRSARSLNISRPTCIKWITLIYFFSGACSLIDEVVWVRLLKLSLGNTVYASSIVISVFMGGLAIGALIMGRFCDSVKKHLSLYALLETLVTISALALPWMLKLADHIYIWFYREYNPSHGQLLFVQVLISAAILLIPTILMGSTLPLLGRFITSFEKQTGHLVGKLYAVNTLGAAAGCFLAGFVLIRLLGVMGTLYAAAILNLLVAFGSWLLSYFFKTQAEKQVEKISTPQFTTNKKVQPGFLVLITAFFISGLICIGYELIWMRSIVQLLGGFTYVFSAVLTIYLLGNVIGTAIGTRFADKLKNPALGFALTMILLGACGLFYLPILLFGAENITSYVNQQLEKFFTIIPISSYLTGPLLHSLFFFLIPSIIMGIGFPIALQAWANNLHKVGWSTGTAYGVNTIGAVAGGLITGFVLLPHLGLQLSIITLGLTGIWIAVFLALTFSKKLNLQTCGLVLLAISLTVFAVKCPADLFHKVVQKSYLMKDRGARHHAEVLEVKEALTATLSIRKNLKKETLALFASGRKIAGDAFFFRGVQKMLGHFGVFLNKNTNAVMSLGFGSGESTACLAIHNLNRIDCVEIEPEVVKLSLQYFPHINLKNQLEDKVNMIFMDAKNYLHLTDVEYDVIVSESINPRFFAENASLYTKEYFESAKKHLKENGLFLSWIPSHHAAPYSEMNSLIGTMMEVFPYVTIWYMIPNPAAYFVIIGSEKPQHYSPKHIDFEMSKPSVRKSLSEIHINNSRDVLSCYLADKQDLQKIVKEYTINSDFRPFIEFDTETVFGGLTAFKQFLADVRSDSIYRHIDWTGFTDTQKQQWLADYKQLYKVSTFLIQIYTTNNCFEQFNLVRKGLKILPENPALLRSLSIAENDLLSASRKMILDSHFNFALELADDIADVHSKSSIPYIIRSRVFEKKNLLRKALSAAEQAVKHAPDNVYARYQLGMILLKTGQYQQAALELRESLRIAQSIPEFSRYKLVKIMDSLAAAYVAAGQISEGVKIVENALDIALATKQKQMARQLMTALTLFRQNKPF